MALLLFKLWRLNKIIHKLHLFAKLSNDVKISAHNFV